MDAELIPNTSILVADDEPDVRELICVNLKNPGFDVVTAEDGASTIWLARLHLPALLVLDVMMPGMSGVEVCRVLKNDPSTFSIPIVLVTAKAEEADRIRGLEVGADDYVAKPFSPRELVLRIQSILRRRSAVVHEGGPRQMGEITIDHDHHLVAVSGRTIDLTVTEFKLLALLTQKRGHVFSRDELRSLIWGYEKDIETRTVDTHMRRLREKLGTAAKQLRTVRGFGYRIIDC